MTFSEFGIRTVGIIGTAGRKDDASRLNSRVFAAMYRDCVDQLSRIAHQYNTRLVLVSGGAAWADHLAVRVFMNRHDNTFVDSLKLYLPSKWDRKQLCFTGNADADVANYYHRKFTAQIRKDYPSFDSLADLHEVITSTETAKAAHTVENMAGFKSRNLQVGSVEHLIAYTFGTKHGVWERSNNTSAPSDWLKDGGTKHTWTTSKANYKIHRNLNELI